MRQTLKLIAYTVMVWLATLSAATADPISITGGVLTLPRLFETAPLTLTGTDGVRAFTFDGFISRDAAIGPYNCTPCTSQISIDVSEAGDAGGNVTYGNESYTTGNASADTQGAMRLDLVGGLKPLPPKPTSLDQRFTFSAPFALSGTLFPPVIPGGLRNTLTGSGIATVMLGPDPTSGGPIVGWRFLRAEYRFGEGSGGPAPVPEPASFVLLASGLSALLLKRRSRLV